MIIRNDDVNYNTNSNKLTEMYALIKSIIPECEIWSCITLFSGRNSIGSVYADLPLKEKEINWFYKNANSFIGENKYQFSKIASHGLYHVDHSKLSRDAQEMSILGSCSYLNTNIFVPPFNRFNQDTLDICFDNDIKIKADGWKSMEFNMFDSNHKNWYLHSWLWEIEKLKEYLSADFAKLNS